MKCDNCGVTVNELAEEHHIKLFSPKISMEWWCRRCRHEGILVRAARRYLPIENSSGSPSSNTGEDHQ